MKKRVGVAGLGNMGKPMARNLLKKGYSVAVYDVRPEPMEELKAYGATVTTSPRELGENSEIVFVMVLDFPQMEACVFAAETGLLYGMKPDSTFIICSTIGVAGIRKIAEAAAQRGINILDSPVSGGVLRAEDGSLTMMVSGDETVFESCKEVLMAVGSNAKKVGKEIGVGQIVKAANQLLVSVNIVAVAEAMVLGTKAGADPEVLFEIIRKSVGNSYLFEEKMPTILKGDFSRRGGLGIQIKDLDICLDLAKQTSVPLFMGAISREIFVLACAMGLGSEDISAVIKVFEKAAGVEVRRSS